MQFTLKEEIIEQLTQIIESIDIIMERSKDIRSVNDFLSSP